MSDTTEAKAYAEARRRIKYATVNRSHSLDLSNLKKLTSLPPEIFQLSALRELSLGGNQLTSLPPEIGKLSALTSLDLGSNQLTSLPPEIGQLSALTSLNLGSNKLTSLPIEIGQLSALTSLNLWYNQLTSLPPEVPRLSALISLDLGLNLIRCLPPEIGQLSALISIGLAGTRLTSLPPEITQLSALTSLDLRFNNLTSLPPEVTQLYALTSLDLSVNGLTCLPPKIAQLPSLTSLDLSHNQLTSLPHELRALTKLEVLRLHRNPALGLTDEMLGPNAGHRRLVKAPAEILAAYFALHPQLNETERTPRPSPQVPARVPPRGTTPQPTTRIPEPKLSRSVPSVQTPSKTPALTVPLRPVSQPLHELRILILGDGAVGKTSLLRQLVSGEPARLGEDKTTGIAIARWPLSVRGVNVTAHVWDFGGQGEMHAAHPYFFGRRTLYLLVVEGRQDHLIKERLGYWLQMVRSHGGHDARVLVVQNKADQHQAALVEQDWRARHAGLPASGAFHAVSCLTGRGVDGLRSAILEQVEAMPSVWEKWPASWLAVKAALAQRLSPPQPVLSLEEGCRLCAGEGIGDDIGQITLLKNLHDLGAIVAYPGDTRLAALGIMDPVWVKSGVYALLNHPQLIEQQGEAREDQLQELLGGLPGYSLRHCHGLLELMVKFELAFRTARGWILPGLLPPNALPQALAAPYTAPDKPLRFEFHYELLPETLITRFIARQHGRAAASATASWWRHGMLLQCEGCPALVQAQVGAHGRIRIAVAGQAGRRRDAMTLLRAAIEDLHSEPQREAVGRMVPLPEHPEVAVPYERLLHLEERNIKSDTVHHGRNPLTFLVSELLDGVGRPEEGNTYHIYNNHVHGLGATLVQAPVTGTLVAGNAVVDLSSSTTNLGAQG